MPFTAANVLFRYKRRHFCLVDLHREVQVITDSEACTVLFSSKKKIFSLVLMKSVLNKKKKKKKKKKTIRKVRKGCQSLDLLLCSICQTALHVNQANRERKVKREREREREMRDERERERESRRRSVTFVFRQNLTFLRKKKTPLLVLIMMKKHSKEN